MTATLLLAGACKTMAQHRAPATTPPAEQRELTRAVALYEDGRMQEAEPVLIKILGQDPKNETANETLGLIYAQGGAVDRALPYLTRAARAPASSASDHANLGAALLKLERPAAALPELELAARLEPKNAQTASELGQAYMLNHDPASGAKAFAAAAAASPPGPDLLYNWALALLDAGDTETAAAVLARIPAGEISPEAESLAGDVDERLGRFMPAVQHYRNAAAADPNEANVYALALEFLHHWAWEDAHKIAEFGTTKFPESDRLKLALGISEYGAGQYLQAATIFSSLLDRVPENATYADLLGRSCSEVGPGQDAPCARMLDFAKQHPGNASACIHAAEQLLHQPGAEQNLITAETLLKNALAADPKSPEAFYQMGTLDQQRMQWNESAEMFQRAIALRPSYAAAHYQLARAYTRLKQPDKAKEELELQRKYSQEETARLDANLRSVSIFLPKPGR